MVVISIYHSNYAILTREADQVVEGKNGLNPEIDYTGCETNISRYYYLPRTTYGHKVVQ